MKLVRDLRQVMSLAMVLAATTVSADVPQQLRPWLQDQHWHRDTDGPVISLGQPGRFDDTHLFAPAVADTTDGFQLWYCGSRGTVAQRVFELGLATSTDGRTFRKHPDSPVFRFGDGRHSILTPSLLRHPNGTVQRENGRLRMWFSSTWFEGSSGLHTLHETTSEDGIHWSPPSPPQLDHVYAPTVIRTEEQYEMWFSDVRKDPWTVRHAVSRDGRSWDVTEEPVLIVDQEWEQGRLFYPTVLKIREAYLMWYGSYSTHRPQTTSLGFAVSLDGVRWYKHPKNPVLEPDPKRPWESHYVTSQSVMQMPDGSLRIWYASRTKPPFVNKYFAIGTAVWTPAGGDDGGSGSAAP